MWPRIYIIWLWFVCQESLKVLKVFNSYFNDFWHNKGILDLNDVFYLTFSQLFSPPFFFNYEYYSEELSKIYDREFFLEYKVYLDFHHFFPNDFGFSSNLFDVCEIFIYSRMRRYRIVLLYLLTIYGACGGISDEELEKYEKEYKLIPIESDECVTFTRDPDFPSKDFDWEKGSLWAYLKLEEGIYMP